MDLKLYNTKSRELETFTPITPGKVTMYNCGPTVYNFAHIGNLRAYVFADVLRRTLEFAGYDVHQVINITDVGHLVGDGDEGEDKMTAALKREGKPLTKEAMREVGDQYTKAFIHDLDALNIMTPQVMPRATDHIKEDIELINILLNKGSAYKTRDGIYFDTSTFPDYANFAKLDLRGMQAGIRVDMGEKHNTSDFSLWKFNNELGYDAPFGKGFPGWHIECSAMIHKHLGHPIDIHTGGVDHIPVHHTNEIAQSETAYGAPFVNYWMHSAHMTVEGEKMSKSLGNTYTLNDLEEHGISPMAFRYWLLTASYRTQVNFTWGALEGAQRAYDRLRTIISSLPINENGNEIAWQYHNEMDIDTPKFLSAIWITIESPDFKGMNIRSFIGKIDKILGLHLLDMVTSETTITPEIESLLNSRQVARDAKNFPESDRLREEILKLGYEVKDTAEGQKISPLK